MGAGVVAATLVALAAPAQAHVAVDEAAPNGDGSTSVTLAWNHSCSAEAPTTALRVSAGPGVEITGASTSLPGWDAVVGEGEALFSGPGLPTDRRASVEVTVRLTGSPGDRVLLPAVQECGADRLEWTDPDPSSDQPAPSLIATAALIAEVTPEPTEPSAGTIPASGVGDGADLTQALGGVLALAVALAVLGAGLHRRTDPGRRAGRPSARRR